MKHTQSQNQLKSLLYLFFFLRLGAFSYVDLFANKRLDKGHSPYAECNCTKQQIDQKKRWKQCNSLSDWWWSVWSVLFQPLSSYVKSWTSYYIFHPNEFGKLCPNSELKQASSYNNNNINAFYLYCPLHQGISKGYKIKRGTKRHGSLWWRS